MDLQKIKALIDLLAESPLAELELIEGDEKVRLVRARRQDNAAGAAASDNGAFATRSPVVPGLDLPVAAAAQPAGTTRDTSAVAGEPRLVRAPMFGIVHLTPAPGEPQFARVGDTIEEGQVLCTIEAMKMFHAIESEFSGTIAEILVEPGNEVEGGQPLFRFD
jgi:acetyl-CoA carboxylase biotin carboxyl carrier protein